MPFRDDEIRTAIRRVRPPSASFRLTTGRVQTETEFRALLAEASESLISDPDAALYLLLLLCRKTRSRVQTALEHLETLQERVSESRHEARLPALSSERVEELEGQMRALQVTEEDQRERRLGQVVQGARAAAQSLGIFQGGDVLLPSQEAYLEIKGALEALAGILEEISALGRQFDRTLKEYQGIFVPAFDAQVEHGLRLTQELKGELRSKEAARRPIAISLLSLVGLLRSRSEVSDPLQAKFTAYAEAGGTSTRAQVAGTISAPFLLSPGGVVNLLVDGTAFTWNLPSATRATLRTGVLSVPTIIDGDNDQVRLEINGALLEFSLPQGDLQPVTVVANFHIQEGITAILSEGAVLIETDARGSGAVIRVLEASANETLGLGAGMVARGTDVGLTALQESLRSQGAPFLLHDELVDRFSGLATADGSSVLVLASVPESVQVGDSLDITEEPGRGTYKVTAKTASTLTVNRSVPSGTFKIQIYRQTLLLESRLTTSMSSLEILSGGAVATLGLPVGEVRGETFELFFPDGIPHSVSPVRPMDRINGEAVEAGVREARAETILLDTALPNDFVGEVTVIPLGASTYQDTLTGLLKMREVTEVALSTSSLKAISEAVLEALLGRGKGKALSALSYLKEVLESLDQILTAYQAVRVPVVDRIALTLQEWGLDRAYDLFVTGRLQEFFSLTFSEGSYKALAQRSIGAASSEFPVPSDLSPDEIFETPDEFVSEGQEAEGGLDRVPYLEAEDEDEFVIY